MPFSEMVQSFHHSVHNLKCGTRYNFSLIAVNSIGKMGHLLPVSSF